MLYYIVYCNANKPGDCRQALYSMEVSRCYGQYTKLPVPLFLY